MEIKAVVLNFKFNFFQEGFMSLDYRVILILRMSKCM